MDWSKLTKRELIDLIEAYDEYIYNDGEEWGHDRQPVGIEEFYDNEYQEEDEE
jgi:hypothetical protein